MQNGSGSQSSGHFTNQTPNAKIWDKEKGGASGGSNAALSAANGLASTVAHEGPRAANALASWRARRGCQLDITNMPGTDLLTTQVRILIEVPHVLDSWMIDLAGLVEHDLRTYMMRCARSCSAEHSSG